MRKVTGRRPTLLALALVAGGSAALAACNFIVDAGSYSVGNGSDASTDGTSTLDTGTTPGDTGTTAVDSGTGDTGSTATDTGTNPQKEAGMVCGQGLPTTAPSFKQLVSSCAIAVACSPGGFQVNMSDCITEDYLHSTPALGCLTAIRNCTGFTTCLGSGTPTTTQCPATSTGPYCTDAGVGINCGGSLYIPIALDCAVLGGTCGVYTTDAGAAADCKVVSSCTQTDPNSQYCQGNDLFSCVGGVGYGQNCGSNQTCIEDPTNGTSCYFNAATCAYSGADTYACNGNTVDWCTSINGNGAQFPLNCSTAGLGCVNDADQMGNAGCLAPGCTATDVSNCTEACSGSSATVCLGGAPYTFDCKTVGASGTFSTCAMLTDSSGNPYAACQ